MNTIKTIEELHAALADTIRVNQIHCKLLDNIEGDYVALDLANEPNAKREMLEISRQGDRYLMSVKEHDNHLLVEKDNWVSFYAHSGFFVEIGGYRYCTLDVTDGLLYIENFDKTHCGYKIFLKANPQI